MRLSYERYLDQILGGWIGNSMGGAIGARFEGQKRWIEIDADEMFPPELPPNDDLDLQVLWLHVLEERGAALTGDDLAAAWLDQCWYPMNEYGIFRRNWRLGIHPPYSGRFTNQFWETGLGCPIRAQIFGYAFPGAPDLAAHYAGLDGSLDHSEQSVGAERMLAAMVSMAFVIPDVRRLAAMFIHYLPPNTPIERLVRAAFRAHEEGLPLRAAHARLMALGGIPEACDAQINVPFTFLGLLYGANDQQATMLSTLRCGYDTDSTLAMAAALVGQIQGASRMAPALRERVGDELVMGIKYRRPEMTLSALARDTARVGVLLARDGGTGTTIEGAPELEPLPPEARPPATRLRVDYIGLPVAAPGEVVQVEVQVEGSVPDGADLRISAPPGWTVVPNAVTVSRVRPAFRVALHAPEAPTEWPLRQLFTARLASQPPLEYTFGVTGAGLWQLLGVFYDALPDLNDPVQSRRRYNQHFVALDRAYLPEPEPDVEPLYREMSRNLGRPALVVSREHEVDVMPLVGLRGPYCAYLARTVVSPDERSVYLVVGNSDGYRLYLNGDLVGEADESVWWTPFNAVYRVGLRRGANRLLLKLLKRGEDYRFTLGIRADTGGRHGHNGEDWTVDLLDGVPDLP